MNTIIARIPARADAALLLFESDLFADLCPMLLSGGRQIEVSGSADRIRALAEHAESYTDSNFCCDQSERQACLTTARRLYELADGAVPAHLVPRRRGQR